MGRQIEEVELASRAAFFGWVLLCCELLGWPKERGVEMMPVGGDPSWYFAYDDGSSPDQAVAEYQAAQQKREQERQQETEGRVAELIKEETDESI